MSQQQWNPKISGKQKGFASILFFLVIGFIALMILSSTIFITLGPGEKGVLFKRFSGGVDKANVMNQGFHFVAPWNKVYTYDIRVQEVMETMQVLSKNGLKIGMLQVIYMKPFPSKKVVKVLEKARKVVAVENNYQAQLAMLIREYTSFLIEHRIVKYDGRQFNPYQLSRKLLEVVR